MNAQIADEMTDAELDALFPASVRRVSPAYWTSVAIARRAAEMLKDLDVRRVLDLGSGPGKFCVVAAARAPHITFVGVEHRAPLVTIAQAVAERLQVANASFCVGDATQVPWTEFDAFYVYNSFAENDFEAHEQFDQSVELSRARHLTEAKRVARRLGDAPVGTVVLTYHGLSGPMPGSYELLHAEPAGNGWLRAWRKNTASARGRFWLEEGSEVTSWNARHLEDDITP